MIIEIYFMSVKFVAFISVNSAIFFPYNPPKKGERTRVKGKRGEG